MRLHELVRDRARTSPDAPAVSGPDGRLTYAELDAEADRAAHALAALGVGRGDRVALWLPKGVRVVAAMQAALRLGAAYVPVDPLAPVGRAARLIGDCAPRVVLTSVQRRQALEAAGIRVAVLTEWPQRTAEPPADPGADEDDLAYILYTSGSTGTPKGVCLSHRNALAFVSWAVAELQAGPGDRFANHAPFHFDLSVLDLYGAFHAGASVHLIAQDTAYAPSSLVSFLTDQRITIWYSVPSALVLMTRAGGLLDVRPPDLRAVLFAGEPYPVPHLRRLREHLPGVRLLNLYGPTETNVCTYHEVMSIAPEQTAPVPIGQACSGDHVRVVRADGSEAAPGEEGELVVEGPTVMLGYWGGSPQAGTPYATGDRVVCHDGVYHYLGRRDGMVKIGGHRVELGEVEAVLHTCPGVADAAVVVSGVGLDARLVAYLVPVAGHRPSLLDIKRHCAAALPRHMIVDVVRYVTELPRSGNGKTDRGRLATL